MSTPIVFYKRSLDTLFSLLLLEVAAVALFPYLSLTKVQKFTVLQQGFRRRRRQAS